MITGGFLIITLMIVISLHSLDSKDNSIGGISGENKLNIPFNSDDKLKLSTKLINHLGIFSQQINKQLNLRPNTITFFTTRTSNSVIQDPNESNILWIYSHLKYPGYCINNHRCKENFHSKLEESFTKLSEFLSTIDLHSYQDRELYLDWCTLIGISSKYRKK
jgi:hypothetical protein